MAKKIKPGKLPDWINERRKEADLSPHSGRIHREIIDKISPVANHGTKFQVQPGQQRLDALGRLMLETMRELEGKPTARDIWQSLPYQEEREGCLIQERENEGFEYDRLWWHTNGREKTTDFRAFQKRITHLRKKLRQR